MPFLADGSTNSYTFATAPASGDVFHVYSSEDDSTRKKLSDTFTGDGSTTTFTLSTTPNANALIEFIPADDDGVLTPTDDRTLDSIVKGGLFTKDGLYGSALGSSPSDINVDGDEFLSATTSYAPEEAVPGQIFDTVDIKVYTSPESGVPLITEKTYIGNGSTTTYSIGEYPGTLASVTVAVDGVTKKVSLDGSTSADFTVNVGAKTITFTSAPANNSVITTKTFAISGVNYRVLDQYTGDGSTVEFTTSIREDFNIDSTASEVYVTKNGLPTTAFATSISSGSSFSNSLTITFVEAPKAGDFIQVAGYQKSGTSRSHAAIRAVDLTYDGSTTNYALTYPPGSVSPLHALTIVEMNGKVLRGPDTTYYRGDGTTYTFGIASTLSDGSTVDPAKTITNSNQIEVHYNGRKLTEGALPSGNYTVDLGNQTVSTNAPANPGDIVAITTLVDKQYHIDSSSSSPALVLDVTQLTTDGFSAGPMRVTTYNNALGMKLRREVLEGRPGGVHELYYTPLNASNMYVWFNGEQLAQGFDYTLSGSTITISGKTITSSDRLDVMYFALESATGSMGFRIFKDMMNRTFYKRISKTHTTSLTETLAVDATEIVVADGSVLANPTSIIGLDGSTVSSIVPGVIFVGKERIEYFTKSNNRLGQIKRGTLGTGIKEHGSGAEVVDASGTQTIPYVDTVYTNTFTGDGSTATFTLSQTPSSASELDIFIGGQRLLLTSEDGSTINYSVDGSSNVVTLSSAPAYATQVKILHKRGQVWYTAADGNPADGKGLQGSTTQQAKFIANEPTNAPE